MSYEELREHYSHLSDEELLQVAGGGDDFRPEAVDAAKSELSRRRVAVTEDRIQSALAERKQATEELDAEMVAKSGFDGALILLLSGRWRQAKTALSRAAQRLLICLALVIVALIIIFLWEEWSGG